MKRQEAIKRTQRQVVGNPAVITILPIVFDVVMQLVGACRKPQDAVAACKDATPAQRARIAAEIRRRLKAEGKPAKPEDIRAAIDAACQTGKTATNAEVTGFVVNSYAQV
jgi:hypothetical protein